MQRYMNKSNGIFVEAVQLTQDNVDAVANWTQSQVVEERDMLHDTIFEGLNVKTPEGKKRCSQGMYVVKVNGNFYVTGAVAFDMQYESIR
jgi:hypothetical protein